MWSRIKKLIKNAINIVIEYIIVKELMYRSLLITWVLLIRLKQIISVANGKRIIEHEINYWKDFDINYVFYKIIMGKVGSTILLLLTMVFIYNLKIYTKKKGWGVVAHV
jgi:F0F1-type ATP synthase assembly protein I